LIKAGPDRAVEKGSESDGRFIPFWTLVSLIVIGSGIALLVW
jgi:hypothetical protein